jgi:DNA-directed RNA polymerase subunit M/transcription elongation factor TFIIS
MVEFCEKCGGMLFPSKNTNETVLICNSCGEIIPLEEEMKDSYKSSKEIPHPPGEEYKNLKKMKNWKKK